MSATKSNCFSSLELKHLRWIRYKPLYFIVRVLAIFSLLLCRDGSVDAMINMVTEHIILSFGAIEFYPTADLFVVGILYSFLLTNKGNPTASGCAHWTMLPVALTKLTLREWCPQCMMNLSKTQSERIEPNEHSYWLGDP